MQTQIEIKMEVTATKNSNSYESHKMQIAYGICNSCHFAELIIEMMAYSFALSSHQFPLSVFPHNDFSKHYNMGKCVLMR